MDINILVNRITRAVAPHDKLIQELLRDLRQTEHNYKTIIFLLGVLVVILMVSLVFTCCCLLCRRSNPRNSRADERKLQLNEPTRADNQEEKHAERQNTNKNAQSDTKTKTESNPYTLYTQKQKTHPKEETKEGDNNKPVKSQPRQTNEGNEEEENDWKVVKGGKPRDLRKKNN